MNLHPTDFSALGPAFVAGLVTSLHCAGMCGPLACSITPVRAASGHPDANLVATIYHACRLGAYALVGAASGAVGRAPLQLLSDSALRWVPWLLVIFFVGLAMRWNRLLPKLGALGRLAWRVQSQLRGTPLRSAAALGLSTPLLPCGPLYLLFAFAMIAGSAAHGAEVALAFGLGTVPLLWLVQMGALHLGGWLRPATLQHVRTGGALLTAAVIAWRLRATLGFPGPDPLSFVCF